MSKIDLNDLREMIQLLKTTKALDSYDMGRNRLETIQRMKRKKKNSTEKPNAQNTLIKPKTPYAKISTPK